MYPRNNWTRTRLDGQNRDKSEIIRRILNCYIKAKLYVQKELALSKFSSIFRVYCVVKWVSLYTVSTYVHWAGYIPLSPFAFLFFLHYCPPEWFKKSEDYLFFHRCRVSQWSCYIKKLKRKKKSRFGFHQFFVLTAWTKADSLPKGNMVRINRWCCHTFTDNENWWSFLFQHTSSQIEHQKMRFCS